MNLDDPVQVNHLLEDIESQVYQHLKPSQQKLQEALARLAGRSWGSVEANQQVCRDVNLLLNLLYLRAECMKKDCRQPAFFVCHPVRGMKEGAFQMYHKQAGRQVTHGGSRVFPATRVVQPAPDRRRARRKSKPQEE